MKLAGVREGERGEKTHTHTHIEIRIDVRVVHTDGKVVLTSFPSFNILGGL